MRDSASAAGWLPGALRLWGQKILNQPCAESVRSEAYRSWANPILISPNEAAARAWLSLCPRARHGVTDLSYPKASLVSSIPLERVVHGAS